MKKGNKFKEYFPVFIGFIAVLISVIWFLTAPNRGIKELPKILGHREGCVVCHLPMNGFEKAHDPSAIGCVSCHLGNPFTMDKSRAHKAMVLVPGNLTQVKRTCGTSKCHPVLADRVMDTLMATGRGMVAVDRFVFGETDSPDGTGDLSGLGSDPADDHLRKLCASCHLGKVKDNPRPIDSLSRGGGCTACHLRYTKDAVDALERYVRDGRVPNVHPGLSIEVTGNHCFGCHSRSGRISTNYEGWHETKLKPSEVRGNAGFRVLEDKRVFCRVSEDVHFKRSMECIDCHSWREAMGDGKVHFHEEEQVEIGCEDCHPVGRPATLLRTELKDIDKKIVKNRKTLQGINRFVVCARSKKPLLNVTLDSKGNTVVVGKNSGRIFHPKRPAKICKALISGHKRLPCQSCHTPWAPTCISCHTSYDQSGKALDHITGKRVKGRWVERRGEMLARQPALGVRTVDGRERVDTFVPGMILTIGLEGYPFRGSASDTKIFRRLYAPTAAHTTSAKGLECKSCHINSVAMGLGEGLFSAKKGKQNGSSISFQPLYEPRVEDGLAEDAWVAFLSQRRGIVSTRAGARPFSTKEQKIILRVGLCLSCHPGNGKDLIHIYNDFPAALKRITPQCQLPEELKIVQKKSGR